MVLQCPSETDKKHSDECEQRPGMSSMLSTCQTKIPHCPGGMKQPGYWLKYRLLSSSWGKYDPEYLEKADFNNTQAESYC